MELYIPKKKKNQNQNEAAEHTQRANFSNFPIF